MYNMCLTSILYCIQVPGSRSTVTSHYIQKHFHRIGKIVAKCKIFQYYDGDLKPCEALYYY